MTDNSMNFQSYNSVQTLNQLFAQSCNNSSNNSKSIGGVGNANQAYIQKLLKLIDQLQSNNQTERQKNAELTEQINKLCCLLEERDSTISKLEYKIYTLQQREEQYMPNKKNINETLICQESLQPKENNSQLSENNNTDQQNFVSNGAYINYSKDNLTASNSSNSFNNCSTNSNYNNINQNSQQYSNQTSGHQIMQQTNHDQSTSKQPLCVSQTQNNIINNANPAVGPRFQQAGNQEKLDVRSSISGNLSPHIISTKIMNIQFNKQQPQIMTERRCNDNIENLQPLLKNGHNSKSKESINKTNKQDNQVTSDHSHSIQSYSVKQKELKGDQSPEKPVHYQSTKNTFISHQNNSNNSYFLHKYNSNQITKSGQTRNPNISNNFIDNNSINEELNSTLGNSEKITSTINDQSQQQNQIQQQTIQNQQQSRRIEKKNSSQSLQTKQKQLIFQSQQQQNQPHFNFAIQQHQQLKTNHFDYIQQSQSQAQTPSQHQRQQHIQQGYLNKKRKEIFSNSNQIFKPNQSVNQPQQKNTQVTQLTQQAIQSQQVTEQLLTVKKSRQDQLEEISMDTGIIQSLATSPQSDRHQFLTSYQNIDSKIDNFSNKKQVLFQQSIYDSASVSGKDQAQNTNQQQHLSQSNQLEYSPQQLFEEFFIIGPDQESLLKQIHSQKLNQNQYTIKPNIYYHFKANQNVVTQQKIIGDFVFPFGVNIKNIDITESLSDLNEIRFQSNTSSGLVSFVLSFRMDEYKNNNEGPIPNAQVNTNNNLKTGEMQHKVKNLMQSVNPQKNIYCICFKVKDYIELGEEFQKKSQQNKKIYSEEDDDSSVQLDSQSDCQNQFLATQKVFCFITYYPFVYFFHQIMMKMLNFIKLQRLEYSHGLVQTEDKFPNIQMNPGYLSQRETDRLSKQSQKDSEYNNRIFFEKIETCLGQLSKQNLPDFNQIITFQILDEHIKLELPVQELCYRVDLEHYIDIAFAQFSVDEFIMMYLSLLLENSIVFVSENISVLSAILLLFQNQLPRPFKWALPAICNLPENLMQVLDSPVPILAGINKDISYIRENKLDVRHNNCIFVSVGTDYFEIINKNNLTEVATLGKEFSKTIKKKIQPYFDILSSDYAQSFKNIDINLVARKDEKKNNVNRLPLSQQPYSQEQRKEACFWILQSLSEIIETEILEFLPEKPYYLPTNKQIFDYNKIAQIVIERMNKPEMYFNKFFKTQMFTYYLDEKYTNKLNQQ